MGNSLGFNFKSAFRTWENNKGYPVINVYHDASTRQFKITQKRYVGGSEEVDANDEYLRWFIPLSYTTGVNSNFDDGSFKEFFLPEENEKVISTSDIAGKRNKFENLNFSDVFFKDLMTHSGTSSTFNNMDIIE